MKYFRNTDLVRLYNVSDKTVRNWIAGAQQRKNDLSLYIHGGKTFIVDSLQNEAILEDLVRRGRKYRNQRTHKDIFPTEAFYELFTPEQIAEIMHDLEVYREYPQQFRYLDQGGKYWDAYLRKLYEAGKSNILTAQIELLRLSESYLSELMGDRDAITFIDLGVGNGTAIKNLALYFQSQGKQLRYIGIDTSPTLLDIAKNNLRHWLGEKVPIDMYLRDFAKDRFTDITARLPQNSFNLIFMLGGSLPNVREPSQVLTNIHNSIGTNDVLLTSTKLDNERSRDFFDFNPEEVMTSIPPHTGQSLQLLDVNESLYEVEQRFDPIRGYRLIQVRLKVEVSLHFNHEPHEKVLDFQKGETILLWRAWHYSEEDLVNLFANNGFGTAQITTSPDNQFVMHIARLRSVR